MQSRIRLLYLSLSLSRLREHSLSLSVRSSPLHFALGHIVVHSLSLLFVLLHTPLPVPTIPPRPPESLPLPVRG